MKKFLASAIAILLVAIASTSLRADTISLGANKDVTIFQNNVNSSGGGNGLFAGTNGTSSPRRALLAFDIAGNVPDGAVVQAVQLTLTLGQVGSTSGSPFVDLFRVSQNWGEGTAQTSNPPSDTLGGQGQGAVAGEGDATWSAAMFSTITPTNWTTPGGDFMTPASASLQIVGTTTPAAYTWPSTTNLVADVQSWLEAPANNFGWILKNQDEIGSQTLRAFYSRNTATAAFRPVLTVTYTVPEPGSFALAGFAITATFAWYLVRHTPYPRVLKIFL